ncbi:MAG: hypothetical protein HRU35_00580 [Rickettsiaceae bacterium]|nr:hypothetical protein [Rickettsiaceae bacterium]
MSSGKYYNFNEESGLITNSDNTLQITEKIIREKNNLNLLQNKKEITVLVLDPAYVGFVE